MVQMDFLAANRVRIVGLCGKVSLADKMQIQTLHEQRLGVKAIMATYPDKGWALSTVKKICQRVDQTGQATECKACCGRPKYARSEANIAAVIFNAEKWVGGHVKKSITSSLFKRIILHLAVGCRTFQKINL